MASISSVDRFRARRLARRVIVTVFGQALGQLACPLKSSLIALVKVCFRYAPSPGSGFSPQSIAFGRCMLASDGGSAEGVLAVIFLASYGGAALQRACLILATRPGRTHP